MNKIYLIAHNIRSSHNIGSLFRTCEGLGIDKLILSGYSPYPTIENDSRLPHIHLKITKDIKKTALGAEDTQPFLHIQNIDILINDLKSQNFMIVSLEQSKDSISSLNLKPRDNNIAVIVGNEISGISKEVQKMSDEIVMIPMAGSKESFNVVQASAMILYQLKYRLTIK